MKKNSKSKILSLTKNKFPIYPTLHKKSPPMHISLRNTFLALLIATAFTTIQAQGDYTFEFKDAKALQAADGDKLICGQPVFGPESKKGLTGQKVLKLIRLSSNFDGKYFKRGRMTLALEEPLSKDFAKWYDETDPSMLILRKAEKGTSTVYQIVGHTQKSMHFLPTAELFPEFAEINLVDFSNKKTMKKWKKRKLIAGAYAADEVMENFKDNASAIQVYYPSFNYGDSKGSASFMTVVPLEEELSEAVMTNIKVMDLGDLVFEKVSGEGDYTLYKLVGYSKTKFTFLKGSDDGMEEKLKKENKE